MLEKGRLVWSAVPDQVFVDLNSRVAVIALTAASCLRQGAPLLQSGEEPKWQTVDQLCGQLERAAPTKKTFVIGGKTETRLYATPVKEAQVPSVENPAREPEVRNAHRMVGMQMRKENAVDFGQRDVKLGEAQNSAAAAVEEESLAPSFHQDTGAKALHAHVRRACS